MFDTVITTLESEFSDSLDVEQITRATVRMAVALLPRLAPLNPLTPNSLLRYG